MSTAGHEERRRPKRLLTLAIATIASVVAAIVTSKVSDGGVVAKAALTPVIVAVVTDVLSARMKPDTRSGPAEPRRVPPKRRFPFGVLLGAIVIGLLAFVIAAVALTLPEIVADKSITGESGHTTYFGDNEDTPWGETLTWSDCLDDIEQCVSDIIDANR